MTTSPFQVNAETYDEIVEVSTESSDDEYYLSDDDEYDNAHDDGLSSVLPSHLQILYGVCLVGTRSYAFLAQKLLRSLETLSDNITSDNIYECIDTKLLSNQDWMAFHRDMTQPMNKMGLFAFVATSIHTMGLEKEWAHHLSVLFKRFLAEYEQEDLIGRRDSNQAAHLNNSEYLSILLVHFRMEVFRAEAIQNENEGLIILYAVMTKAYSLKDVILKKPKTNASRSSISIEVRLCKVYALSPHSLLFR